MFLFVLTSVVSYHLSPNEPRINYVIYILGVSLSQERDREREKKKKKKKRRSGKEIKKEIEKEAGRERPDEKIKNSERR